MKIKIRRRDGFVQRYQVGRTRNMAVINAEERALIEEKLERLKAQRRFIEKTRNLVHDEKIKSDEEKALIAIKATERAISEMLDDMGYKAENVYDQDRLVEVKKINPKLGTTAEEIRKALPLIPADKAADIEAKVEKLENKTGKEDEAEVSVDFNKERFLKLLEKRFAETQEAKKQAKQE